MTSSSYHPRLSERIERVTMAVQAVLWLRVLILVTGTWDTSFGSNVVRFTDPFLAPLSLIASPMAAGRYIIDLPGAIMLILTPILAAALCVALDRYRMRSRSLASIS